VSGGKEVHGLAFVKRMVASNGKWAGLVPHVHARRILLFSTSAAHLCTAGASAWRPCESRIRCTVGVVMQLGSSMQGKVEFGIRNTIAEGIVTQSG
jgi:hypothetical protein